MSKKIKPAFLLEIIWFLTFILCLAASIYKTTQEGVKATILFYLLTLVSLLMFLMRRYMRKSNK